MKIVIYLVLNVVVDEVLDAPEGGGEVGHLELNTHKVFS